jgi:hypothetical protein
MGRACSTHGGEGNCLLRFGGKRRRKRQLGIPERSWENNIEMDLRDIE